MRSNYLKLVFLVGIYLLHGKPFVGVSSYIYILLLITLVLFGSQRKKIQPLLIGAGAFFFACTFVIPQLAIPEQYRLLVDQNKVITSPDCFMENEELYPYFPSADGYLQGQTDKRFVSSIDIDGSVLSLRSGWVNRQEYNFYGEDNTVIRAEMPYVVTYEIIPDMVGMELFYSGQVYLEKENIFLPLDKGSLIIESHHVGSKITGFSTKQNMDILSLCLKKTLDYRIYDILDVVSLYLGLLGLFFGLFSIHLTKAVTFQISSLGVFTFLLLLEHMDVFQKGILVGGGSDGIVHGGFPYWMLEKWIDGDWLSALISPEKIFYFMPGMRYVRFVEMLLFGDAYILQVGLLCFMPIILYRFFSVFLSQNAAMMLSAIAFVLPRNAMGFSYSFYTKYVYSLYGEAFAYGLFFISLTLLAKRIRSMGWGFLAFFLAAVCLSIRPNLAVFFAVIACAHLFSETFTDLKWTSRFWMLFGFVPVFLIPLHNIYGGEFVLLTSASNIPENLPLTPMSYWNTILYLLGDENNIESASKVLKHLKSYHPHYVFAWLFMLWVSIKGRDAILRVYSFAVFLGLGLHFFFKPSMRYIAPYLVIFIIFGLHQIFSKKILKKVKGA
ncbi:MAG: hypothetical protein KBB83_00135 [Alphaproteobacteria bacterium]|nr:hypothetical protein [Alphaproteobacteria bacterium]